MPLNEFSHYFVEAKLTSKQRNKLDDTQFGIPSLRKYPLTDKKHVLQAVRFFNKAPEEHKPELARNIVKRAKELNMDWEKWDVLKPYLGKHVKEAYAKELHSTPEADGCIEALKDVEYDNASPDTWRLKTPLEVLKLKKGNCHDTSYFVHNRLNGHKRGVLFFIEYADGKQEGGQTHSVCYEKIPHGICVIECSWEGMKGTFPYNDINEYIRVVKRNWKFTNGFDKLYSCEIKNFDKIKPGISLGEYVEIAMKNKEIVVESYGPEDDNDDYEPYEPDDCYCEEYMDYITEADKALLNELQNKENNIPPMQLKKFAEKCIKVGHGRKKYFVFELPDEVDNTDKKSYMYFDNIMALIQKYIDSKKWIRYELTVKKFFNAIGVMYNKDRVLISHKNRTFYFEEKECLKYTFNPSTDILVHGSPKSNLQFLKPVHESRDGVIYPRPRIYALLMKRDEYSAENVTDDYGSNKYIIDVNNNIEVFRDTEILPGSRKNLSDKYGKAVFINTYKPLPVKPFNPDNFTQESYIGESDINGIVNANMIASRIHEKYKKDGVGHVVGNQNCQLCTWCAEAQFRGRNDMPRPIYSPRDPALEIVGEDIVKNPRRISLKSGFDDLLYHITEANNSRWYCHVKWVDGHGGHEFLILNIDGKPYLMDPQQGLVDKFLETHGYIKDTDWGNSYICRLDTNELNVKLLEDMNDMSKLVQWDAKLDIPYMLKEGMLTEDEAEQYWKEHPDERPKTHNIFTSGDFDKYGKDVDLTTARGPIQEGFMMEFDHNSEKIPVPDKSFDKLYFGSPTKYDGCIELDRPLFVSPFIGIASIFIFHDIDIQKHVPRGSYNLQYEEWLSASKEKLSKPLKDVHVYVEGYPELEPYEIENTGYIHVIDGHEYAGRLCRYDWMAEDLEYLIDNSAQNEVHIDKVIECTVRYHISGKATDNPKLGPYKKNIQEAATELPENIWMRKAINADRDYIFKVEMETLDEKYKNDPKVVEMIRQDAYDSVRKTRIICHRRNRNENETIGLLQAYQKDDYWYIGEIYLEPPFRGKGIARTILEKEISEHDWLSLDVNKNNKHAIDLYLSLGFKIVDENDDGYRMDLKKEPVQEGAWNDIKNGVNPFSNKLVYHVSTEGHYDGQVFKPRVPEYLEKSDDNETHFEDTDNPRVCFSPSIEGALNAIIVNLGSVNQMRQLKDLYVYIPEKPLKEYKHRTTKQLVKEKKVFDANITREIWIEEPVRLKEYGVIRVDQVSDYSVKKTVPNTHGNYAQRYRYDFKWHWVIKPKVLKNRPFDYSPEIVSRLIVNDLWKFKYGLIKDGRLINNASESDYDKYWKLSSPETFDEVGGGNCADFTEWTAGYFDAYDVKCKKYFMDFGNNFHTFVVVEYDKKEKHYTLIDGAIRHISKGAGINNDCPSLNACFDFLLEAIHKVDPSAKLNGVYDFTNEKIDYGTPMKEYINWIKSHGKKVNMSKPTKEEYDMSDLMRDPDILRMIMEAETEEEDDDKKKDTENTEDTNEEKDDVETKDDDDSEEDTTELKMSLDEIEFGADTSDIQNEYDTKEVDTLNDLIAAESQALSEYLDAAKTSKVPLLSRLYSDIGDEERFHLEQLLYAKSTLTGERYEPRDPEVRKEYEELMALGMDEETAMTTAVDKFNLRGSEEDVEETLEEVEETFNMIITSSDAISLQCAVLQEVMVDKSNISDALYQESMTFMENMYVMEEVDNLATRQGQKALGTKNPFVLIAQMYRAVYKLVVTLIRKAKLAFQKIRLKDKRRWAWIKKHGIRGLFQSGVHLYFYSDKTNSFEITTPLQYLKLIHDTNSKIVDMCKLNVDLRKYKVDEFLNKLGISFEPIQTSSIEKAVDRLNSVQLTKTKVVVTDKNEAELERLFFDYTPDNYTYAMNGQADKIKMSKNIYHQMTIILDAFGYCNEETNAVIDGLENIAGGTPGKDTVFNTNPKLYNTCTNAMRTITKAVNMFNKAVTSDINQILSLDKGLREAVQAADQDNDKTKLNEYRKAQAEGQAAEDKEAEASKNENNTLGSF